MKKNFLVIIFITTVFFAFFGIKAIFSLSSITAGFSLIENKKYPKQLTLEQKIGQLFIIGFEGRSINREIERTIKELHPGGILLLERNIENKNQLKNLINSLQKIALEDTGLPLLIFIDQEGGSVSRVSWVEKTAQAEIENSQEAYQIGKKRGEELRELGINVNFSPLLDVAFPQDFIFERSFQTNPEKIGDLAKHLILGQKEAGILTAIKHFPGYGAISFNPEERLAELKKLPEISQFKKALEALPEIVMVSNVVYEEIEERIPFSFSKKGIRFLKDNLGGNFLILSDDLAQNSLIKNFSLKEIVTLPLKAGVEMLIFSGWRIAPEEGVLALREAAKNEEISKEEIDKAVLKIIDFKKIIIENQ